jgi:hypothetical protein
MDAAEPGGYRQARDAANPTGHALVAPASRRGSEMGFLRRALGGGEKAPDWASFMKADEYRAFEAAVAVDFE